MDETSPTSQHPGSDAAAGIASSGHCIGPTQPGIRGRCAEPSVRPSLPHAKPNAYANAISHTSAANTDPDVHTDANTNAHADANPDVCTYPHLHPHPSSGAGSEGTSHLAGIALVLRVRCHAHGIGRIAWHRTQRGAAT